MHPPPSLLLLSLHPSFYMHICWTPSIAICSSCRFLFFTESCLFYSLRCMAARSGRHLQRYNQNHKLVVGCIPYRYKDGKNEVEVLVISSKKSQEMMFPKGGWEIDESAEEAASRESLEEAGVVGNVESELGRWIFKSKSCELYHQGLLFPLLVTQQLDSWPEKAARNRQWMNVGEAREACGQWWMKEALDKLVDRLRSSTLPHQDDIQVHPMSTNYQINQFSSYSVIEK